MCVSVCVCVCVHAMFNSAFSLLFSDCYMHFLAAIRAVWISKCVFLPVCVGFFFFLFFFLVSSEDVCVFALKSRLQDADIIGAVDLTHCSPPLNRALAHFGGIGIETSSPQS